MSLEKETAKDKKLLEDCLSAQVYVTERYGALANPCSTPKIKMTFLNLVGEEHRIQNELLGEQIRRGWKELMPAEKEAVSRLLEETQRRKKNAFQ